MGCMRLGGTVENTLKGGGTEKRGGKQRFLKGRQAGSRGGCLKKEGTGTPLRLWVKGQKMVQNDKKFLSAMLHISGPIHHMIVIYGKHVYNDSISSRFFLFFKILIFLGY